MITKSEHHRFEREGFLGPFDLPAGVIDRYRAAEYVQRTVTLPQTWKGTDRPRNQHVYSRSVFELATEPSLISRVSAVLGPDVLLWVAHILVRQAGDRGQAWHSDAINQWVRGLHVSIAISDNDLDNGCLRLIPGSHLYRASLEVAERTGKLDRWDWEAVLRFADGVAPWHAPHRVVAVPIRAGQYFFTWGGLWHAVGRNDSSTYRSAFVARYARPDVACRNYGNSDGEIQAGGPLPCILATGQDTYGLNHLVPAPVEDILID